MNLLDLFRKPQAPPRRKRCRGRPEFSPRIEHLEDRVLLSVSLTGREQLLLDLINRARANPAGTAAQYGIDLNEGLAPGTITTAAKQPLAPHQALVNAAGLHSQDMLDNDYFSHTNAAGQQPWDRATAAGYPLASIAENIAWNGSTGSIDQEAYVHQIHKNLFVDSGVSGRGHRLRILNAGYREGGTGVRYGVYTTDSGMNYNAGMAVELFGNRGGNHFLTGLVFNDLNGNARYDSNEGLGGVTIATGAFTTTTGPSGGWSLQVPDGQYSVTASGGSFSGVGSLQTTVSGANVELDFVSGLSSGYINYVLAETPLGSITFNQLANQNPSAGNLRYSLQTFRRGILTIEAILNQPGGNAKLTLYNSSHNQLATSTLVNGNQRIDWNVAAGQTYYLSLSGTSSNVNLRLANLVQPNANGSTISIYGTNGNDTFQSVARTQSSPLVMIVNGVRYDSTSWPSLNSVSFFASAGNDTARHTGSAGNEVATLAPSWGTVVGPGYTLKLSNVESTIVNGNGGNDTARLYGWGGNDRFFGKSAASWLTGNGFLNVVQRFARVDAYATAGGTDRAFLYDSGGHDRFFGKSAASWLTGNGFLNLAHGFDRVDAYATAGGWDRALLYDSAGNDRFFGKSAASWLTGNGFLNVAHLFERVDAYATAGGSDRTFLYDSAGSDRFFGQSAARTGPFCMIRPATTASSGSRRPVGSPATDS